MLANVKHNDQLPPLDITEEERRTGHDSVTTLDYTDADWVGSAIARLLCRERQLLAAHARIRELEATVEQVAAERDHAVDSADRLAYAIGTVEEMGEHSNCNDPWEQAHILLLDKLEPRETRWISVADRLPEPGRVVLTIEDRIVTKNYIPYPNSVSSAYEGRFYSGHPYVTHWMPLPAPPATQEDKV